MITGHRCVRKDTATPGISDMPQSLVFLRHLANTYYCVPRKGAWPTVRSPPVPVTSSETPSRLLQPGAHTPCRLHLSLVAPVTAWTEAFICIDLFGGLVALQGASSGVCPDRPVPTQVRHVEGARYVPVE